MARRACVIALLACAGGCAQPRSGSSAARPAGSRAVTALASDSGAPAQLSAGRLTYPIVGTGQDHCYGVDGGVIDPRPGDALYGQDAQDHGRPPAYRDNGDGTVTDLVTGLMWQQDSVTPGKLGWEDAEAYAARLTLGGHDDWRVPSIKELYSLIDFRGRTSFTAQDSRPYLDTRYFKFAYGDAAAGERFIDCQYWSSTPYVSTTMDGNATVFGVNFADGRIKGYPQFEPGPQPQAQRPPHKLYVRCVRGNPAYGVNRFRDNGDGTVTDSATGLTWLKYDSGHFQAGDKGDGALDWPQALAWAGKLNYAGHDDWRLPTAKELQSIVDYTRSPDTTHSAAIDPVFDCTPVADDDGAADYAYYWTGTTHLDGPRPGDRAVYVCFGRAGGYMARPPWSRDLRLMDVHGAGAQRSDMKQGDPADFPRGMGPQGDVQRIYNMVRCVRGS